jgi:hypothetical protein
VNIMTDLDRTAIIVTGGLIAQAIVLAAWLWQPIILVGG